MRATRPGTLALILAAALSLPACGDVSPTSAQAAETPHAAADALPASLDALFPPRAERPVFLFAMLEMGDALDGLVADALERDTAHLAADLARLDRAWDAARALVPEWRERYPREPLDALGTAVRGGDAGAVLGSVEGLGGVCAACHHTSMVAVQQRYHWGDFESVRLTDPLASDETPFPGWMHRLATNLAGITTDLAQGQVEGARRHLAGLTARYETLEESCGACHTSERRYFVGADVAGALEGLRAELAREAPDADVVGRLAADLGERSCHRCHLVHVPAALGRRAAADR